MGIDSYGSVFGQARLAPVETCEVEESIDKTLFDHI